MAEITMRGVTKRYPDGTEAVSDVNLDIADGEFVILVGPSGCGKSTLLRMIVGLEDISSGEMRIGDRIVNDLAPKDRDLAMVFQSYALYPHLTVRENMAFPLRLAKVPDAEVTRRVEDAARVLELTEQLERKPANMSGGQRQRVAMGRAIVRDPKAFLFDEPLSNLDAKLRVQMRTEIARVQKKYGTTTVYVTHDQTEAMTLGDRVAVLRKGVVQQVASPRELYNNPANLFVAGFIGSPAMNFLPARVSGGRVTLPFAEMDLPAGVTATGDALIAGIRPENFQDAALVQVEWLGSELFAYLPIDTARVGDAHQSQTMAEISRELDTVEAGSDESELVVRLDPQSDISEGGDAELWMDVRKLLLFDPHTGANLTPRAGAAAAASQQHAAPGPVMTPASPA
jgi:multiple sugar transport system ATP-binding protein